MMLGVFIAQVSNGGFVGNEVQYVVGMNPIALVITFYILVLRSERSLYLHLMLMAVLCVLRPFGTVLNQVLKFQN